MRTRFYPTMEIENRIAYLLVNQVLNNCCTVSVNDGEEVTLRKSANVQKILDALGTTDSDFLIINGEDGERVGYFWLIWGNGQDLISDYSASNESDFQYMADVIDIVDEKIEAYVIAEAKRERRAKRARERSKNVDSLDNYEAAFPNDIS